MSIKRNLSDITSAMYKKKFFDDWSIYLPQNSNNIYNIYIWIYPIYFPGGGAHLETMGAMIMCYLCLRLRI